MGRTRSAAPSRPDLSEDSGLRAAYAAHGDELYRFALRQLADPAAAQDVVQEVFLRAWRASDRFDPELASLRSWLYAIARHVVVDQLRHRARRPSLASDDDLDLRASEQTPFDETLVSRWLLEEALGRLTREHRDALLETHVRGRPYAEVAASEGIPEGTLRSRVYYALRALRLALDEMGVNP